MSRSSKAHPKTRNQAKTGKGKPLASPLIAEVLIVIIAALLRNGVVRMLEKGRIVQTEQDRKLLKSSPARRVALVGAKQVATRSVPGALLIGAGIVCNALIRGRRGG